MESQRRSSKRVLFVGLLVVILIGSGFAAGVVVERSGNLPGSAAVAASDHPSSFGVFWQVWDLVDEHYVDQSAIDDTAMTYGAIQGMLDSLGDEGHTRFLSPEALQAEQEALSGQFEGIGAHLTMRDGMPTILAPIAGSPAQQAGLRPGDVIVRVDGEEVSRLGLDEIVGRVRGPAGTTVVLTVVHPGETMFVDITVERAKITVPNVTWAMLPGTSVAHVLVSQFAEGAGDQLIDFLREAKARGASAIILDLRNDPGGIRDEAVAVASQFLTSGNVLIEVDAQGNRTEYPVREGGTATDVPLAVLVNEGTASSSEIVAGALQDHKRAKVIGTRTTGTGTVLSIFHLSDGSAVFLGTRGWLTPNGREIWHRGIEPDVAVPLPVGAFPLLPLEEQRLSPEQLRSHEDAQLLRALEEVNQAVPAR